MLGQIPAGAPREDGERDAKEQSNQIAPHLQGATRAGLGAGTFSRYLSETLRAVQWHGKLQLGPAKLGKAQPLRTQASEKRRAAARVPAPLLATRRTSAEPLDARAPPARARHPRAAPALFAAARGVGRRAPLSRHLVVQRPRSARGRLPSLPAGLLRRRVGRGTG